jgi:hypothetical protein
MCRLGGVLDRVHADRVDAVRASLESNVFSKDTRLQHRHQPVPHPVALRVAVTDEDLHRRAPVTARSIAEPHRFCQRNDDSRPEDAHICGGM